MYLLLRSKELVEAKSRADTISWPGHMLGPQPPQPAIPQFG